MANDIYDVMSGSMLVAQIDKRFITNGTPYVFIDGDHIPGAKNPRYTAGQPTLNPLTLDARVPPECELRSFGGYGEILFSLTSEQANAIEKCIGMGALSRTQAQINADRTVGDPTLLVPVNKEDMMFCLLKVTGAAPNASMEIDRLPFTDIDTTAASTRAWVYDTAGVTDLQRWHNLVTGTAVTGVITITDPFIGNIDITSCAVIDLAPFGFTYDPSTAYTAVINGDTVGMDYIDPTLVSADTACIVGLAFKWGQLVNTGDYSIVNPYVGVQRVAIDFIECLGDAPTGNVWSWRRFFWCEQVNLPDYAANAESGAARETEFRFRVKPYTGRFLAAATGGGASYFHEYDTIIIP
ncbi:MAG: hypothetical protein WC381_10820 [Kiritimatiellia bacterium]|jgi:hypothetical protein